MYQKEENSELRATIREEARKVIQEYMKSSAFTDRKITDTPTDALGVVNRKFVTNSGASSSRPASKVQGQRFFDTTINKPIYWKGTAWVDGTSSVV
jgi:hypothetical protein